MQCATFESLDLESCMSIKLTAQTLTFMHLEAPYEIILASKRNVKQHSWKTIQGSQIGIPGMSKCAEALLEIMLASGSRAMLV